MARDVNLPSGAILSITPSPFAVAKALNQAVLKELRGISFRDKEDTATIFKELFCAGFSSPDIDRCLTECLKRCTYDSGKGAFRINDDTFEPMESRQDYIPTVMEVCQDNIGPFVRALFAEFGQYVAMNRDTQK